MKSFPLVLGTDILRVTRFDPLNNNKSFRSVVKRILTPSEFPEPRIQPRRILDGQELPENPVFREIPSNTFQWLTIPFSIPSSTTEESSVTAALQYSSNRAAIWLAGRWAAKEAAKKAWGASILGWKDVRVEPDTEAPWVSGTSRPIKIVCQPDPADYGDFNEPGDHLGLRQEGRLSISHDGEYCVATVIAEPLDGLLLSLFKKRASIIEARKRNAWKWTATASQTNVVEQPYS